MAKKEQYRFNSCGVDKDGYYIDGTKCDNKHYLAMTDYLHDKFLCLKECYKYNRYGVDKEGIDIEDRLCSDAKRLSCKEYIYNFEGYNEWGYDKHDFDREGHDITGLNRFWTYKDGTHWSDKGR